MINAKGETIYTNSEIAYELGLSPATVNAVGKRLFGCRVPHWTLADAELIVRYIKSISAEEEEIRLLALHKMIDGIMQGKKFDDEETKKAFTKDIYLAAPKK